MDIVVIRGGGDIATGIAHRLYKAGFKIIIFETSQPLAIRRTVSFCEAIYNKEFVVEGVTAVYCNDVESSLKVINQGNIAVLIDPLGESINKIKPIALVDSILAKRNLGTIKNMAPITIGIGPGFIAGGDVDLVVESNRGHTLGKVIYKGPAEANTGIPGNIMGFNEERIIRAVASGNIIWNHRIGDLIEKGQILGSISDVEIKADMSGLIRGLIKDDIYVEKGLKVGDIDPRGQSVDHMTISDKARAIGGGVLEGIMYMMNANR